MGEVNLKRIGKRSLWVFFGCLVFFGIIGACTGESTPRASIEKAVNAALSTDLTDPADSNFAPDSNVKISKNSDGSYEVSGYVDCANAFGGKVRNTYQATVTQKDSGDWDVNWIIHNSITGQFDNGDNVESGN